VFFHLREKIISNNIHIQAYRDLCHSKRRAIFLSLVTEMALEVRDAGGGASNHQTVQILDQGFVQYKQLKKSNVRGHPSFGLGSEVKGFGCGVQESPVTK